jgi:hypothetical protein
MRILYSIGKWFLNADVTIPVPESRTPTTVYRAGAFHAFQPQSFPLEQAELDGLHKSIVRQVQTYFDFFEQLDRIADVDTDTKQIVILAMLLDFMSYTAQQLRTHCGSEWTKDELQQGRIATQIEINTIDARDRRPKEGWAQTMCGIVANSGPLTTLDDVNPWECTHPVPAQNEIYKDLPYSPEIYGHRPQFRRAKKLKSPPPLVASDDEPTEFDTPQDPLPASRKHPRPPTSPTVVDLRSPTRIPMPFATDEQIQRWSHPQSPTSYQSPSHRPAPSTFFPPEDTEQSTSSSTSHPQHHDSADLPVLSPPLRTRRNGSCGTQERIAVERGVKLAYGTSPHGRLCPYRERSALQSSPHTG